MAIAVHWIGDDTIKVARKRQDGSGGDQWHFKNITAADSTLKDPAVKRLGLSQSNFWQTVPLFKRLGGRFLQKIADFPLE